VLPARALTQAAAEGPLMAIEGVGYRLIHARFAATALSAIGSFQHGARYNAPRSFEALYLADNPVTALREIEAILQTADGLLGVKGPPRILLSVEHRLNSVVDLCDQTVQRLFGTDVRELCAAWRPINAHGQTAPTQALGALLYAAEHVEALRVPSARDPAAHNLVIFPRRLTSASGVRVYDDSGLIDAQLP
jgi:RES domain-containing protein